MLRLQLIHVSSGELHEHVEKIKIIATAKIYDDWMMTSWKRFVDQSTFVMGIHRWLSEM